MNKPQLAQRLARVIGKIIHFPLVQIIVGIILVNVPTFILRSIAQFILSSLAVTHAPVEAFVVFSVRSLTVYFAYTLFVRLFEKRRAEEIAVSPSALKEISLGGILGLFMITLVMSLMWMTGHFTISGIDRTAPLFQSFLFHSFFAFLQDIVYFAILFRIIEKSLGSWIAILVASLVFGFKHLLFPGYTLWSVFAQTLEAGLLFTALFILSRRIWLICGFHVIWNFVQYGFIMGFDAEGLTPLFICDFAGSNLITGMPVGLEASIITFCMGTALGIYLLKKAHRKGNFIRPFWQGAQEDG